MASQNAHHQHSSALLWIFPPICKLSSSSFSYRHIELPLFPKFRQFSHSVTTKSQVTVILWCIYQWNSHIKRVTVLSQFKRKLKLDGNEARSVLFISAIFFSAANITFKTN
jgi:hypothetical protein